MSNCSRHKKEVAGVSDMKVLAEMIGDLHYESLTELLARLQVKLMFDARRDLLANKKQLSGSLLNASNKIGDAAHFINHAWQISKPFMEENPQTENK